jgi:hypothetical protein
MIKFVNFSFALFTPPLGDFSVFSVPESRDPIVSGLDPTQRGPNPILGVRFAPVAALDLTQRPGLYIQGSGTFPWGPDSLLIPWSISSSLATWRPRSRPRGGVECCCWPRVVTRSWGESRPGPTHTSITTRPKIDAWVLRLHTVVRGTLVLGYRHVCLVEKWRRMERLNSSFFGCLVSTKEKRNGS